jgi:hypothetical protein
MIEQLHDFFIMVGGGAAALTGLVFVALSLNLEVIVKDLTHRKRAIGTLAGFTAIFVICACGLIGGMNNQAFGIEWLIVSVFAAFIYIKGIVKAKRSGISLLGLGIYRVISGTGLYVIEILSVVMFTLGYIMGLYIAALTMVFLLAYTITGAWLLVVGVHKGKLQRHTKK